MGGQVLIVGGGIAGITAALDLADRGNMVYLVERSSSIGGRMAQLDKTFPTLDCSICILAPKMVEASRHPNIRLFTYAEVEGVKRVQKKNLFKATIKLKPRYVDEAKCTGCMLCTEKCPKKAASEFDAGIGSRKAIYIPFPQAVPRVATIDPDYCLYFQRGVCRVCQKFCPADAVDFQQKENHVTVEVSSIGVAIGFDLLDPSALPQYGYGKHPDILTSLQYERLMNAAGPTMGEIVKLSNKQKPKHVVFIQCVGSRNERVKPYCSQICCMYATKQALITREHDPDIDVTILYNDLRAMVKGHEEFIQRAKDEFGIRYVKGLPGEVIADPKTGELTIPYMDMLEGEMTSIHADMIVLCPAVIPSLASEKLAKTLGIKPDEYGFFRPGDNLSSLATNVPGIYVCGAIEEPQCITHTVTQASAVAALISPETKMEETIFKKNFPSSKKEIYSTGHVGEKPRIGVFVCHCGVNIASTVSIEELVEYVKGLPNVVHVEDKLFTCSKDSQEDIEKAIHDHKLNRVIVAACTPRTHEPLFRKTCEAAGLNPYLFEMVNIREQDSWVHPGLFEEATQKAKDLVRMAVMKAPLLEPLIPQEASVEPSALVIGGGISGMTAATTIADTGYKVCLIEKTDSLGGKLKNSHRIPLEEVDAQTILREKVRAVQNNGNIEVLTSTTVKEVRGRIGDYEVKLQKSDGEEKRTVSVIILATGSEELIPEGSYGYETYDNVHTTREFEGIMEKDGVSRDGAVAFINCVGVREEKGREYCSAICCSKSLDQALRLKDRRPNLEVYVMYRDMRVPFGMEKKYREGREKGIIFVRYPPGKNPEISSKDEVLFLNVCDSTSGINLKLPVKHVILSTPLIPRSDNSDLSSLLKIPLSMNGFFLEAHPKLRPVDFATDGVFLCGTAHSPQSIKECVYQAQAAASRALIPLTKGKVISEPIIAEVDENLCIACGRCEAVCEYGAIEVVKKENAPIGVTPWVSKSNPLLCKGCGACAVECPARAITMKHFKDDQILTMIKAALESRKPGETRIIGFLCNWCSYAGADMAGVSRFKYSPQIRIIRVMCSGRVDQIHLMEAFRRGVDGVLVAGCHLGDCHYISGNHQAEKRVKLVKRRLEEMGVEPERLRLEWISAGEGKRFSEVVKEFTDEVKKLGPSPICELLEVKGR